MTDLHPSLNAPPPKAASSIYLNWTSPGGIWFYNEAIVQASARGTYFVICGWDTGYFGIQELGNGSKIAIFSVWDQRKGKNSNGKEEYHPVEKVHAHDTVTVSGFTGEGTGLKSTTPFDWKTGEVVRCAVHATVENEKTTYAGWLYCSAKNEWRHLVTFRVITCGKTLSGLYSFIEDFRRDTNSVSETRRCEFGNGWLKTDCGKFHFISEGKFTSPQGPDEANSLIDAGKTNSRLFLSTGGITTMSNALNTMFKQPQIAAAPPDDLPDCFLTEQ
jgi:hypothetical protein